MCIRDSANTYLKLGYTTVRDMGSNSRCAIAVRNAVQKGQITGPRIYSAGLMISPKDAGNDAFSLMYNEADGREAVSYTHLDVYKRQLAMKGRSPCAI